MQTSVFISAVLLSALVRASLVLKRPASEEAISVTNKKIKLDHDYEGFGSGAMSSPATSIKSSEMKSIEESLVKLWDSKSSHSNLWMVDIGEKCSPVKMNVAPFQVKEIIRHINSENITKYPRLSLCLLTEGILPAPVSEGEQCDFGKKVLTLAKLALPTMNSLVPDSDFRNALVEDILASLARLIPFVSPLQEVWHGESQEDRLRVLKDFDKAWNLKGIFDNASFVLLFPNPPEVMEVLNYLDIHLASSKVFLGSLLDAAIKQDNIDVFEYLHKTYTDVVETISERLKSGGISHVSSKLLGQLEAWGHSEVKNISPQKVLSADNVEVLRYFLDKGYFTVDEITSTMLLQARSQRKDNVLEYLRTQYGKRVSTVASTERVISCELDKVKVKMETGVGSTSFRPGDYLELSDDRNPECLEVLDYLLDYFRQHESEISVAEAIRIISNDYYAFKVGNVPVLNWINRTLKNNELEFPVLTLKMVEEAIENDACDSFAWYKKVLGRSIPFIRDAYDHLRFKKPDSPDGCERWWLFKREGVDVTMADLGSCLHKHDLKTLQFIQAYFPAELAKQLANELFCDALSNARADVIDWATSALPGTFVDVDCGDTVSLVPENLPAFKIAHERTGWAPTEKSLEILISERNAFNSTDYELIQWLLLTVKLSENLQPSLVETFARSKTTLLLRLLSRMDEDHYITNNATVFESCLND